MSAGQLVVVPLCLFLIEWYNWKMAVLLLGSLLIIVVFPLLILFLRTFPSDIGVRPYGEMKDLPKHGVVQGLDDLQSKKMFPILKTKYF
jgi:sugar phosphate permease